MKFAEEEKKKIGSFFFFFFATEPNTALTMPYNGFSKLKSLSRV